VRAAISTVKDANGQPTTRLRLLGAVMAGHADLRVSGA